MRGHVRKRGSKYVYVVDVGRDPETGKRQQRWASGFDTKKEAQRALNRALGLLEAGLEAFPERVTLRDFIIDRWLPHCEAQKKPRPNTLRRYHSLLQCHVLPMIGGMELHKVGPAAIQRTLDRMTNEKGLAPRTVKQARAALSSAFSHALGQQLVQVNPVRATETPTPQDADLRVPTGEELRAIERAAAGTSWEIAVLLATTTGARRGEILGLTWQRVDLDAGTVRFEETLQRLPDGRLDFVPPKTKRARRTVPLPERAVARLRRWRVEQNGRRLALGPEWEEWGLVCERGDGAPADPDALSHTFGKIAESAGVPGVRLHDCRHGVGTLLAKKGTRPEVVSALLGHSSVAFTQTVYTHPDHQQLEDAMVSVEDALG